MSAHSCDLMCQEFGCVAPPDPPQTPQWETTSEWYERNRDPVIICQKMGAEGWEPWGLLPDSDLHDSGTVYFKRLKN